MQINLQGIRRLRFTLMRRQMRMQREYYRNNMMLAVAVLVDLTKCYSVEADGAQVQNIGSQTGVVFTALPGEDGDYTVRIGSDSFESDGVLMTMIPGMTKDLEHVKDLKDAKDTWKEAGDQLYDSMEPDGTLCGVDA